MTVFPHAKRRSLRSQNSALCVLRQRGIRLRCERTGKIVLLKAQLRRIDLSRMHVAPDPNMPAARKQQIAPFLFWETQSRTKPAGLSVVAPAKICIAAVPECPIGSEQHAYGIDRKST